MDETKEIERELQDLSAENDDVGVLDVPAQDEEIIDHVQVPEDEYAALIRERDEL